MVVALVTPESVVDLFWLMSVISSVFCADVQVEASAEVMTAAQIKALEKFIDLTTRTKTSDRGENLEVTKSHANTHHYVLRLSFQKLSRGNGITGRN